MTTATATAAFANSTDADFRAWGKEVSDNLQACGLVKHTDTGQINWATVTLPASNSSGGFEIYKFGDTLHATRPIYIKIEYGRNQSSAPQMWVTIGSATNGSGTISTIVIARTACCDDSTGTPSAAVAKRSDYCVMASLGYAMVMFKRQARSGGATTPACWGFFAFWRSTDDNGDPDATGVNFMWLATTNTNTLGFNYTSYNFATGASGGVVGGGEYQAFVPWSLTSTLVSGVPQKFKFYQTMPKATPCPYIFLYLNTEIVDGTEAGVSLVGSANYTFLLAGSDANRQTIARSTSYSYGFAYQ
jgi:hypothetical protein